MLELEKGENSNKLLFCHYVRGIIKVLFRNKLIEYKLKKRGSRSFLYIQIASFKAINHITFIMQFDIAFCKTPLILSGILKAPSLIIIEK